MKYNPPEMAIPLSLANFGFALTLGSIAAWTMGCSDYSFSCTSDLNAQKLLACKNSLSAGAGASLPDGCCVKEGMCDYVLNPDMVDSNGTNLCSPAEPEATDDDGETAGGGVVAAAVALAAASHSLGEAENLESPTAEVSPGLAPADNTTKQTSAAEAGDINPLTLNRPSSIAGGSTPKLGSLTPTSGNAGGSASSAGGGPGLGALGAGSSVTSVTPDTTALASAASAGTSNPGSVTYTGGSGAKAGAGSGGLSYDYNSTGGSGSGDSNTPMNFSADSGGTSGAAGTPTTDSLTPEDYLARIPIDDSLFHRVELKMREKERAWGPRNPMNRLK